MKKVGFKKVWEYVEPGIDYNIDVDLEMIAEKYNLIYRGKDDAICYCVKDNPNIEKAYNNVFSVDEAEDLMEQIDYFIWDTVIPHLEELEKKLGVEIFSAGRSNGYLCIPGKDADIQINYDKLKKVAKNLYDNIDFNEFETLDEVGNYLVDQLLENYQGDFVESETVKNFYEGMTSIHNYFTVEVWEKEFKKFKESVKPQLKAKG
ncbi:MAG: hypothetical protein QXP36_08420 [Conexivisphaerales archaeon]